VNPVRSLFLKEINYLIEAIKGASNGVNPVSKTNLLLLAGIIFNRGGF